MHNHHPHSPPQSPSLTLALNHQNHDLDFFTPEPLNVFHPPHDHNHNTDIIDITDDDGGDGGGGGGEKCRVFLLGSSEGGGKVGGGSGGGLRRRSPRLVAETAGVAIKKGGSTLLVKLVDTVLSEKAACELARSCLGEMDLKVRCLRSRKVISGDGSWLKTRKRKAHEMEENSRVLRSRGKSMVRVNTRKKSKLMAGVSRGKSGGGRSLMEGNVGRVRENGVEERLLICGPRLSMGEKSRKIEGGRELRSSPRLSMEGSIGQNGVEDNGGGRQLRFSPRLSKGENVGQKGGGKQLKSSPRLSKVGNVARNGVDNGEGKQLRSSPRLSTGVNVGHNGGGRVLRHSLGSSTKGNMGQNGVVNGGGKQSICSPRSSKEGNKGQNGGERQLRPLPRSLREGNKGQNGVERQLKSSLGSSKERNNEQNRVERQLRPLSGSSEEKNKGQNGMGNGVERQLRPSPRSSKDRNQKQNGVENRGGRQSRPSLRSPQEGNAEQNGVGNGGGRQLRRSPRVSPIENLGDNEEESVLRCLRALPLAYEIEGRMGEESGSESMEGNVENIDEEKVLRRSPRGLPSSFMIDDDVYDDDIQLLKKKKKKINKDRLEGSNKLTLSPPVEKKRQASKKCFFVGEPVPEEEARQRWGWRFELKSRRTKSRSLTANADDDDEPILAVKCHYVEAQINDCLFQIGDCALIRGDEGQKHIGRIIEFLRTTDDEHYFRVQWFYKAEDTVMKEEASFHDKKRIFYSTIENDNMLDCIISKLNVIQVVPELNFDSSSLPPSDYYYDTEYCLEYSTFRDMPTDNHVKNDELPPVSCQDPALFVTTSPVLENGSIRETYCLLDLYAGCGAMSTGLCLGARLSGVDIVTRWAIDTDSPACESLRLNHPETQVRNEAAEDFLELLKHWAKLCEKFVTKDVERQFPPIEKLPDLSENSADTCIDSDVESEELEVSSLVDICYGSADKSGKRELKFKVRWKGYGPDDDTWEPIEGLSNCQELIQDFVIHGYQNKILPLPGDVDVICGGPPCQGISGYNRFRCVDNPLDDERNRQLIVFMDIVDYLKPKFVLMENVSDILRFDKGSLGRYALSRLVHMHYQARIGIMAAGCYGVPQFRLRVFFWGALPNEELPQFPLPTHDVVVRCWPPLEFERNVVGFEEGYQPPDLEDAVFLGDAISDLPMVTNFETQDEMPYSKPPETEFQKSIRSTFCGSASKEKEPVLYDHRPLLLFEDDYIRVCQIPRKKGANFRDLPGVLVGEDNVVRRDPSVKTIVLPSGRPMVPDYAFTFEQGKSKKPFARLWWDETLPTIVTYPTCHSQAMLHPEQDRVLTIRECARLQGFPDSYRLCGTVKQRYRQVGNAVAIPVAKALGYALGLAAQKRTNKQPQLTLPPKFAYSN